MKGARGILGLFVLAVALVALRLVFAPPAPEAPPQSFTSSQQCRACHEQVFAEWEASGHSRSWTNPDVRALSNDFANTDCIDCHAPRPVFETGIGNRVLPRSSRRSEGVDCIACHWLPDGHVAGTIDAPSAACRPVVRRELASPEHCAVCHDQHDTVKQWAASQWPARGFSCVDCHMPVRAGEHGAGRDHRTLGGRDPSLVRQAVLLRGLREGAAWTIEVENVGAGHSFPTDERSRAADLFWRPLPAAGEERGPWRHFYRFRSPYRHEVDLEDNLLRAHETRRVPLTDEAARGAIEVALFYKRSPYYRDPARPDPEAEASLVHRIELLP